jgi:hypothetical protein
MIDLHMALAATAAIGGVLFLAGLAWWEFLKRNPHLLDSSGDDPFDDYGI